MKVDIYPVGKEQNDQADEDFRLRQQEWKSWLRELADLVQSGRPLDPCQAETVAEAVRHVADIMPTERPRPNHRPPVVPGDAAILLASYVVNRGITKKAALEELASLWGIDDVETIKDAIKPKRQAYSHWKRFFLEKRGETI